MSLRTRWTASRRGSRLPATHEQEAPEDPQWEALSKGRLSAEEAEALRGEAPDRLSSTARSARRSRSASSRARSRASRSQRG